MTKSIRKAVRCYLINDNKIVAIKYKSGSAKALYYDIPGGKIEAGETSEEAAIREVKEETGILVKNLTYKGKMIVEYPNKIFDFDIFLCNEYSLEPQDFDENQSEWIEISELLKQENILSNIMILDRFFIKGLISKKHNFNMLIKVSDDEDILSVKYDLIEI